MSTLRPMPTLTRWFIKTMLIYFVAGLTLGVAMQSRALGAALPALAAARPVASELSMVFVVEHELARDRSSCAGPCRKRC